jgi:branched-chain amino acid transport system substrate-binding protein
MRGVMSAMLGVEGIRTAQERFGIGQVMKGAQVRWGLENLYLSPARLGFLGFDGVMQPIVTSCADHMGSGWARIQTWRGKGWQFTTGWLRADLVLIRDLLRARTPQQAGGMTRTERTAFDCRS